MVVVVVVVVGCYWDKSAADEGKVAVDTILYLGSGFVEFWILDLWNADIATCKLKSNLSDNLLQY